MSIIIRRVIMAVRFSCRVGVLCLISTNLLLVGCSQRVPKCDEKEVVALTQQILKDSPMLQALGSEMDGGIKLDQHAEESYDKDKDKRTCKAILTSALGTEKAIYTVEWHDKEKGNMWVEFAQ